jgi:hypothetical protein|tara:strand:- start:1496 stop:2323 length:828 start_codon:yes stop_codon:yes gene_type:complete
MPTIKARVGPQNAVRVLAQQTSAVSKLLNLSDVISDYKAIDGLLLVWNQPTSQFIMTSVIDNEVKISDLTQSYNATTGALVVSGGVGVGGNLSVAGIATFGTGTVTVDGDNDLVYVGVGVTLSGQDGVWTKKLTVDGDFQATNLIVTGIATLASEGGITTTGGDLYVGKNLRVAGVSTFIGNATFRGGTIGIGDSTSDDINVSGEFISDLNPNEDGLYDLGIVGKRWRDARFSGLVTSTTLNVANTALISGISTFQQDVDVIGTFTAGLIDGGFY